MANVNYRGRNLKHNKSCEVPRSLVFLDCETTPVRSVSNPNKHKLSLRLGVAKYLRLELGEITREKKLVFNEPTAFWSFLQSVSSPQRQTLCFAHNAIFDLCCVSITDAIDSGVWQLSSPYAARKADKGGKDSQGENCLVALDCPPFILCLQNTYTKARVVLIDTLNYYQCTLEQLGKTVSLDKLPICFDECTDEELEVYCERDVDIIKSAMIALIKWQHDMDLGNFRYTLPSNAFNAFRHRFLKHDIVLHDHESAKKLERASYFGGQTEVYNHKKYSEPMYLVDVNSLYPSVMQFNEFPVRLTDYQESEIGGIEWRKFDVQKSVACVRLNSPELTLPIRLMKQSSYVKGEFTTVLSGPELSFAETNNLITDCFAIATYETAPIFTEFVNYFWGMRKRFANEGNKVWADLCKLYLNSISGKFGQLTTRWTKFQGVKLMEPWTQEIVVNLSANTTDHFRSVGNFVQIKQEQSDHANSFCAIAAFVTAYGRQRMRAIRNLAGNDTLAYQGVDSLVMTQVGMDNLLAYGEIEPYTLGKLKLVECADTFQSRGKMDYDFGDRRVVAGLKRNAIQIATDEFSQTIFSGVESLFRPAGEREPSTELAVFHRRPTQPDSPKQDSPLLSPEFAKRFRL